MLLPILSSRHRFIGVRVGKIYKRQHMNISSKLIVSISIQNNILKFVHYVTLNGKTGSHLGFGGVGKVLRRLPRGSLHSYRYILELHNW